MDYGEAEWLFTKRSLAKTCLTPFSMLWAPQREQYLKKYFRVYHFSKLQFEKKPVYIHLCFHLHRPIPVTNSCASLGSYTYYFSTYQAAISTLNFLQLLYRLVMRYPFLTTTLIRVKTSNQNLIRTSCYCIYCAKIFSEKVVVRIIDQTIE